MAARAQEAFENADEEVIIGFLANEVLAVAEAEADVKVAMSEMNLVLAELRRMEDLLDRLRGDND